MCTGKRYKALVSNWTGFDSSRFGLQSERFPRNSLTLLDGNSYLAELGLGLICGSEPLPGNGAISVWVIPMQSGDVHVAHHYERNSTLVIIKNVMWSQCDKRKRKTKRGPGLSRQNIFNPAKIIVGPSNSGTCTPISLYGEHMLDHERVSAYSVAWPMARIFGFRQLSGAVTNVLPAHFWKKLNIWKRSGINIQAQPRTRTLVLYNNGSKILKMPIKPKFFPRRCVVRKTNSKLVCTVNVVWF
jgi:hypothetical protein